MEALVKLKSTAVPFPIENVDTDQIIPARFLKAITKDGFGDNLFRDWKYDKSGEPIVDFVLNNPLYSGKILVAGKNFGCGSSREHAAWALHDYGFRVIISSFFADIFKANALNNGLLPITVDEETLTTIFEAIEKDPEVLFNVNVSDQHFSVSGAFAQKSFELDEYKKGCLLKGQDDIDYLLSLKEEIINFEKNQLIF